jgi:DNA-binding NarL/FixJ family response regulator
MTQEASRGEQAITIGIMDSDPLRLAGFRVLLETYDDLLPKQLSMTEIHPDLNVDVVILGKPPGCNLGTVMQRFRAMQPEIRVIMSGSGNSDNAVLDALSNGAKGYVDEAAPIAEFVRAVRAVNRGLIWAPRQVMGTFVDRCSKNRPALFGERITVREREVLEMLVAGRSNKEIAVPLGIEERTVKAHVAKLMRKVGVQNRIALSVHAVTHALVRFR